jgi:hypothetical protein
LKDYLRRQADERKAAEEMNRNAETSLDINVSEIGFMECRKSKGS